MTRSIVRRILPIGMLLWFEAAAALARAQTQSTSTPLPHVPLGLPVQAPSSWEQAVWTRMRDRCQQAADKIAAHIPLSRGEGNTAGVCRSLSVGLSQQPVSPEESPQPQFHNSLPTAAPTPDGSS